MGSDSDIKYGGGRYVCEKCGVTVTGSALHHCESLKIFPIDRTTNAAPSEPFVSGTCIGEKCSVCGEPATNKIGEEIPFDDPNRGRHNLTAYVCEKHFNMVLSPYKNGGKETKEWSDKGMKDSYDKGYRDGHSDGVLYDMPEHRPVTQSFSEWLGDYRKANK